MPLGVKVVESLTGGLYKATGEAIHAGNGKRLPAVVLLRQDGDVVRLALNKGVLVSSLNGRDILHYEGANGVPGTVAVGDSFTFQDLRVVVDNRGV